MRRSGFTLIEVLAVVALLGIVAAATAWSMAGDIRRSGKQAIITQIEYADRMARLAADRIGGQCVLRIDLDGQQLRRVSVDAAGDESPAHSLKMPDTCRIDRVLRTSGSDDSGTVDIAYAGGGRSASYAIRLYFPQDKQETWLIFAGLTGQMVSTDNEQEVDKLFENLATGWDDAD